MQQMQSNCIQNQADNNYFHKLYESMRTIFTIQRKQWSCQQILRFLALIKTQNKIETILYEFKINGELLFDLVYLWQQISSYLENKTYFPIMKLVHIILRINLFERKSYSTQLRFLSKKQPVLKSQQSSLEKGDRRKTEHQKIQSSENLPDLDDNEEEFFDVELQYVDIDGVILQALSKQFSNIAQIMIAQLSCNQLAKMFKSTEIQKAVFLSQLIKKYSIDGYCVIFLLANQKKCLEEISKFFSNQQIEDFNTIFNLLLPFYFRQIMHIQAGPPSPFSNILESLNFNVQRSDTRTTQQLNQSRQQIGTSQIFGQSQSGSQLSQSRFGTYEQQSGIVSLNRQSPRRSEMGRSSMGYSICQGAELRNSEYQSSQYPDSERQSIRGSMAQSVFDNLTTRESQKKLQKRRDIGVSSVQDIGVVHKLREVALNLPFNLFKTEPLQKIKITNLPYPFNLNFHKPKSHSEFVRSLKQSVQKLKQPSTTILFSQDFNITGAKFGRNQQNDFKYPDQLSISGKHAQIGFWNNKYQLVDLQSKTGTFLYIPLTRPLILKDQQIIQLSNQIQIVVHILKKQHNEGLIKLQFTKPQNQPFYKASLKQGQTLKIGRSQKSHIKLSQQSIQSRHSQIKYENREFKIHDCLSSTGTWLRLSKKGLKSELFPIVEGDIIRISSKRAYMIEKITNSLGEEDQEFNQYESMFENPNFKELRGNDEVSFTNIIENTWKRKTQYDVDQKLQVL